MNGRARAAAALKETTAQITLWGREKVLLISIAILAENVSAISQAIPVC